MEHLGQHRKFRPALGAVDFAAVVAEDYHKCAGQRPEADEAGRLHPLLAEQQAGHQVAVEEHPDPERNHQQRYVFLEPEEQVLEFPLVRLQP